MEMAVKYEYAMPCGHVMFLKYMCIRTSVTRGFDTAIHPIPKCVIFLEELLEDMVCS